MSAGKQSVLMLWRLGSHQGGQVGSVSWAPVRAAGPHMGLADGVGRMSVSGF